MSFYEENNPFTIKPILSTLGSILEFFRRETLNNFIPDVSIQDFLGSNPDTLRKKLRLTRNPVDILSFDKIFLEFDIPQGIIFLEANDQECIITSQWLQILITKTLKHSGVVFNAI